MSQRDTAATIAWYRGNEVWPNAIGFDPDGMCQKICRTARNIGPGAPSALASAQMTPVEHRVHDISAITVGMVLYFDDPDDSNPFGHIVTAVGRTKDADRDSLDNILVRTNSVRSNQIVVTRASYFGRFWSDPFQFAGTWLNGEVLDLPETKGKPKPKPVLPAGALGRLEKTIDILDDVIENQRAQGNQRLVRALRRDKAEIRDTIQKLRNAKR